MTQQPLTGLTSQQKDDLAGINWMIGEHFEALNRRFDSLEQMTREMTDRLRWMENQLSKPRADSKATPTSRGRRRVALTDADR